MCLGMLLVFRCANVKLHSVSNVVAADFDSWDCLHF